MCHPQVRYLRATVSRSTVPYRFPRVPLGTSSAVQGPSLSSLLHLSGPFFVHSVALLPPFPIPFTLTPSLFSWGLSLTVSPSTRALHTRLLRLDSVGPGSTRPTMSLSVPQTHPHPCLPSFHPGPRGLLVDLRLTIKTSLPCPRSVSSGTSSPRPPLLLPRTPFATQPTSYSLPVKLLGPHSDPVPLPVWFPIHSLFPLPPVLLLPSTFYLSFGPPDPSGVVLPIPLGSTRPPPPIQRPPTTLG